MTHIEACRGSLKPAKDVSLEAIALRFLEVVTSSFLLLLVRHLLLLAWHLFLEAMVLESWSPF